MSCIVLSMQLHPAGFSAVWRAATGLTSNLGSYFTPAAMQSTTSSLSGLLTAYLATAPGTKSSDPQCAPCPPR